MMPARELRPPAVCAAVPRGGITPIAPDIAPVIAPVIAAVTGATSEGWSVCDTEAVERRRQTDMSKRGTDHEEQGGGRAIGAIGAIGAKGARSHDGTMETPSAALRAAHHAG